MALLGKYRVYLDALNWQTRRRTPASGGIQQRQVQVAAAGEDVPDGFVGSESTSHQS